MLHEVRGVIKNMEPKDIARKYKVSRATSYRWLSKIAKEDREGK
jgi:transposase